MGGHMWSPQTGAVGWIRRSAAVLTATGLLAAGVMLAGQPALAATQLSPAQVAASLGAGKIRAEIVLLVDISGSMTADGLYPQVKLLLPRFLAALARQDPQDTVAVIVFGTREATQQVYLGPPSGNVPLPASANSVATDFGYAFKKALNTLSDRSPRIKVGGVLLLSDGELDAIGDPQYNGYGAPGWHRLHAEAAALGIPVTGYGLPLTTNPADIDSVREALGQVFAQQETLGQSLAGLSNEFGSAEHGIEASRVTSAARPDIGHGVAVSWDNLPGTSGLPPLNLAAGRAQVLVTLRSTTRRVELRVRGLSVKSAGFPVAITGKLRAPGRVLRPGRHLTVPVLLKWKAPSEGSSFTGGSRPSRGRLVLSGQVTSPDTAAIKNSFGDSAFAVGGLAGATSAPVTAVTPIGTNIALWLTFLLLLLAMAAVAAAFRARLGGTLILTTVDGKSGTMVLRPWPRATQPTKYLIGRPGKIVVQGSVRNRQMNVRLELDKRAAATRPLLPGGRTMVAGIDVVHVAGQPADVPATTDYQLGQW
jgi:von Willebrand factor type A domain